MARTSTPDFLFRLRFRLNIPGQGGWVTIKAWDGSLAHPLRRNPTHSPIDAEMSWRADGQRRGTVVFPRGATYCAVTSSMTTDGIAARELVTSLFCMKPGDTDADYFEGYTPEQLAWVEQWAETLDCEKQARYCDPETGEPRCDPETGEPRG